MCSIGGRYSESGNDASDAIRHPLEGGIANPARLRDSPRRTLTPAAPQHPTPKTPEGRDGPQELDTSGEGFSALGGGGTRRPGSAGGPQCGGRNAVPLRSAGGRAGRARGGESRRGARGGACPARPERRVLRGG